MLQTRGIVFKQTKFRETSLILDIFTEKLGLQTFIMNGVFKKGSTRLASTLQVMNLIDLTVYYQEGKNMHRIKEVNPFHLYQQIPFQIHFSAIAMFILEICRQVIRGHDQGKDLYSFVESKFKELDNVKPFDPSFHLRFLKDLCQHMGIFPSLNHSETLNAFNIQNGCFEEFQFQNMHLVNIENSLIFYKFINDLEKKLNLKERKLCLSIFLKYFELHVDHFNTPKSIEVFKSIF